MPNDPKRSANLDPEPHELTRDEIACKYAVRRAWANTQADVDRLLREEADELAEYDRLHALRGDDLQPPGYFKQFRIHADTLRGAAHGGRLRRVQVSKGRYQYRVSDVRKLWPDKFPQETVTET